MLKLSVTDLDQVAYFMNTDSMDVSELIRRLRREEPPTDALLSGRSFHKVLERAQAGEDITIAEQDGYVFDFSQLDAELSLPPIREKFVSKTLVVDGVTVELRGKIDGDDGITVFDHKAASRFDAEKYAGDYQWRAYLMMTNRERFQHNVFVRKFDGNTVTIRELHPVVNYAYQGMERDVRDGISEYLRIAREYLPEKMEQQV